MSEDTVALLLAMGPYIVTESGALSWEGFAGQMGSAVFAEAHCKAGLNALSHKKKATFWRQLLAGFPLLIDFLSDPAQLHQVGCSLQLDTRGCVRSCAV